MQTPPVQPPAEHAEPSGAGVPSQTPDAGLQAITWQAPAAAASHVTAESGTGWHVPNKHANVPLHASPSS
jgi:hypothetical protein